MEDLDRTSREQLGQFPHLGASLPAKVYSDGNNIVRGAREGRRKGFEVNGRGQMKKKRGKGLPKRTGVRTGHESGVEKV